MSGVSSIPSSAKRTSSVRGTRYLRMLWVVSLCSTGLKPCQRGSLEGLTAASCQLHSCQVGKSWPSQAIAQPSEVQLVHLLHAAASRLVQYAAQLDHSRGL